jgi:hypothetical protein
VLYQERSVMGAARVRGWVVGLVVVVLVVGGALLRVAIVRSLAGSFVEVRGVRLGMTPSDVRERFVAPAPGGAWQAVARGEDFTLEWRPAPPLAQPTTTSAPDAGGGTAQPARFEFHAGILVGVRLVLSSTDPAAHGAPVDVSTASVLARRGRTDGRVEITLLARDCPTHAEEVHRLLARR